MKTRVKDPRRRADTPSTCIACQEQFLADRRRPKCRFCSPRCMWDHFKGPEYNARIARESASARGDKLRDRGEGKTYRKLNGRHEHRVIAEQKIGRPLRKGEVVHHDDDNKRNNDPGNLSVLPSQAEHARVHGIKRGGLNG